eukprot:IDg22360t1
MDARWDKGDLSNTAFVARGQTRAYDAVQREVTSTFFENCPIGCPLRSQIANKEELSVFAIRALDSNLHCTSTAFDVAWFRSALKTKLRARACALVVRNTHVCTTLPPRSTSKCMGKFRMRSTSNTC